MSLILGLFWRRQEWEQVKHQCSKIYEQDWNDTVTIKKNIFIIMYCNMLSILTESTNSLEQKKHTHRRTFMIFVTKPTWKTGFASSMWPKCPGHSVMLPGETKNMKY